MVDIVTRVNNVVNGFVWGPFGLALLLCTGLWLSVRTGFFQFRRMGYWLKHTIGAIFTNKDFALPLMQNAIMLLASCGS